MRRGNFARRAAFSLLELVAAMAILVVVIIILSRIVTDTQRAWRQGTDSATMVQGARAAFALIADDLAAAMVASNMIFVAQDADAPSGWRGSAPREIVFHRTKAHIPPYQSEEGDTILRPFWQVRIAETTNGLGLRTLRRTIREVPYDLDIDSDDNSLWDRDDRREWVKTLHELEEDHSSLLLDNILELKITSIYPELKQSRTNDDEDADDEDDTAGQGRDSAPELRRDKNYDSAKRKHRLPLALDIEVALLPDRAARRWQRLPKSEQSTFKRQNQVRLGQRFIFPNRTGERLP